MGLKILKHRADSVSLPLPPTSPSLGAGWDHSFWAPPFLWLYCCLVTQKSPLIIFSTCFVCCEVYNIYRIYIQKKYNMYRKLKIWYCWTCGLQIWRLQEMWLLALTPQECKLWLRIFQVLFFFIFFLLCSIQNKDGGLFTHWKCSLLYFIYKERQPACEL